jgi:hypothetical protein
MHIVLPGFLPDLRDARQLANYLPETAPTLMRWCAQGRAHVTAVDPATALCTADEFWQLQTRGFRALPGQHVSAGLGPMLAACAQESGSAPWIKPDQPVWLAELVHVAPSRDGAVLIPAAQLDITLKQSAALLESTQDLLAETPFSLQQCRVDQWLVSPPGHYAPACASPLLVSQGSINDWWTQDLEGRPWRRLVNELQMLWFDHPVNQQRARQNLPAINSLWLFGGARPEQLAHQAATEHLHIFDEFRESSQRQDWGNWLQALKRLDAEVFTDIAVLPHIIMTGSDRIIEVTPHTPSRWRSLLPGRRENWRTWWSHQN